MLISSTDMPFFQFFWSCTNYFDERGYYFLTDTQHSFQKYLEFIYEIYKQTITSVLASQLFIPRFRVSRGLNVIRRCTSSSLQPSKQTSSRHSAFASFSQRDCQVWWKRFRLVSSLEVCNKTLSYPSLLIQQFRLIGSEITEVLTTNIILLGFLRYSVVSKDLVF